MTWLLRNVTMRQSSELVIVCFFIYKATEALLQSATRIHIYRTVCSALVDNITQKILCKSTTQIVDFILPNSSSDSPDSSVSMSTVKEQEVKVQHLSSIYLLIYRFLFNLPACIACIIHGSWSNRIGRKWSMVIPCVGALCAIAWFAVSLSPGLQPIPDAILILLLGIFFYGVSGKSNAMSMGANSYIADLSTVQQRTKLFARILGANFFGLALGATMLAVFYRLTGFILVLIFSFCSNLFVGLLLVIFIADSYDPSKQPILELKRKDLDHVCRIQYGEVKNCLCGEEPSAKSWVRRTFDNIKLSYFLLFARYERREKNVLLILLGSVLFNQMVKSGEQDSILLFVTNQPFRWSAEMYGYYLSTYYGCMAVWLTILLPLIDRYMKPKDTTLILIGMCCKIGRLLAMGLSSSDALLFISAIAGSAAGFITSGTRSLISKTVSREDIGASFALVSCMETFANLFGGTAFTTVYNISVSTFPGTVFIFDAILHCMMLIGFIWVRVNLSEFEKEPLDKCPN